MLDALLQRRGVGAGPVLGSYGAPVPRVGRAVPRRAPRDVL